MSSSIEQEKSGQSATAGAAEGGATTKSAHDVKVSAPEDSRRNSSLDRRAYPLISSVSIFHCVWIGLFTSMEFFLWCCAKEYIQPTLQTLQSSTRTTQ